MTDITDQYRRAARRWADHQLSLEVNDEGSVIAARVILATVEAPAPTLADEIRGLPDFTMSGDSCISDCHERADDVAFRVDQMEHDLAEARAEVERLTAERDEARDNEADESMRQRAEAWVRGLEPPRHGVSGARRGDGTV